MFGTMLIKPYLKLLRADPTTKIINSENRYYTNNQITKSGQYKLYDKKEIVDHIAAGIIEINILSENQRLSFF